MPAIGLWLALSAACSGTGPHDSRTPGDPQRIVSLSPALTEILFALDVGERVVGVTDYCDYPPETARCSRVGGYVDPSVEAILALRPDLVLVSPNVGNRQVALIVRRAGVRLEVLETETLEDAYAAIERVAELAGVESRGKRLAEQVRSRLARVHERVSHLPAVTVLFCLEREPLIVAGAGTLPAELIRIAGGRNVIDAERYPTINIEGVLTRSPQVILQSRMDRVTSDDSEAALRFWGRWEGLPAVRDRRVHVLDGTTAFRAGPRVAEAAEQFARLFYPDLAEAERAGS